MKKAFLLLTLLGSSSINGEDDMSTIQQPLAIKNEVSSPLIGGVYKHYKGKEYVILCIAYNSQTDTLEPMVVYQGLYTDPGLGPKPIFTQSLERFLEPVIIDGKQQERFALVRLP